jgi:biopolymer transport protein ExbB
MIEIIIKGGSMMVPLMICSLVAIAVFIDRWGSFRAYSKIDSKSLRSKVIGLVMDGKIEEAIVLCGGTPGPVSAVLLAGLQRYRKLVTLGKSDVESVRAVIGKAMDDYMPNALNAVETRLNWLSTVGNAAPLFGMTGTVTGMINSFTALAGAASLDAAVVGAGIAEALITTAAGLLIALAAVIPYNYFMGVVEKIALEINDAAAELVDGLVTKVSLESSEK